MNIETSVHYSCITVYIMVALLALDTLRYLFKSKQPGIIKELLFMLLLSSAGLAGVFSIMQIIWASNGEAAYLAEWESIGWLLHDWLNAISHLSFVLAVRVFTRWDEIKMQPIHYRRISEQNCAKCAMRIPKESSC